MIRIKELEIIFSERILIKSSDILIPKGKVTYLTGESGCGKSSILKVLANVDTYKLESFIFNNSELCELSQEENDTLRKTSISYVSQDEPMVKNYTLMENLQLILKSKHQSLDENKLYELMDKLSLSKKKLNKKVSSLSSGERQRFALICSLLGDYELYLYDEPTSSLDETNREVVNILLQELAQSNKMVVIAEHKMSNDPNVVLYHIENKNISCNQNVDSDNEIIQLKLSKILKDKKIYVQEAIRNMKHMPFFNSLSLVALSMCIALTCIFTGYSKEMFNTQATTINDMFEKELFVINGSISGQKFSIPYDETSLLPIDEAIYEQIKNIDHVKNIEPHFFFKLKDIYLSEDGRPNFINLEELGNIVYSQHGEIKKSILYNDLGLQDVYVGPTYSHQNFDEKCKVLNEGQEGFYITSDLAKVLGIEELDSVNITINVSIPIASNVGACEVDVELDKWEKCRDSVTVVKELTLPVRGILNPISVNAYNVGQSPVMFLPIDMIKDIMQEVREENVNLINSLSLIKIDKAPLKDYSETMLLSNRWDPSAYIIEVDHYENISEVKSKIMKIDNNLLVRDAYFNGSSTIELVNQQKMLSIGLTSLLMTFTVVFMVFIRYFKMKKNTHYYRYLQRIGWSVNEIKTLIKKEYYVYTLLLIPMSIIIFVILNNTLFRLQSTNLFILIVGIIILGILLWVQSFRLDKKMKKVLED